VLPTTEPAVSAVPVRYNNARPVLNSPVARADEAAGNPRGVPSGSFLDVLVRGVLRGI
jgi:hypothetical protein